MEEGLENWWNCLSVKPVCDHFLLWASARAVRVAVKNNMLAFAFCSYTIWISFAKVFPGGNFPLTFQGYLLEGQVQWESLSGLGNLQALPDHCSHGASLVSGFTAPHIRLCGWEVSEDCLKGPEWEYAFFSEPLREAQPLLQTALISTVHLVNETLLNTGLLRGPLVSAFEWSQGFTSYNISKVLSRKD